jgi:periplasmic protein TonB
VAPPAEDSSRVNEQSDLAPQAGAAAGETQSAVQAPDYRADYLDNPPPTYPRMSRRLREEGEVTLRVRVTPEGRPAEVVIAGSSGSSRLDQAAWAAVQSWRFAPARQGTRPVEAWVVVPIVFRLEG